MYTHTHTHTHSTKPLSSVINPPLLAEVVFPFPLRCVLAVGAVFPRSALLALCCGNTTWSLLHPTTLGHGEDRQKGIQTLIRNIMLLVPQIIAVIQ